MKVLVISDSFKGSLSSEEISEISKEYIKKYYPNSEVVGIPVADGGEGTVDCFYKAIGGDLIKTNTTGPYNEKIVAEYLKFNDTAIIEMAKTAGLPMVIGKENPSTTTTFGVGTQILHAIKNGAKHIILGLGGSATNDFGCGAACALGVLFYNEKGEKFIPTGESLSKVCKIDISKAQCLLQNVKIEVMCDIDNPTYGEKGAAYVFAPQKGADKDMVEFLDKGLMSICEIVKKDLGIQVDNLAGGGAAGGFGAGMAAFFNAKLRAGIDVVLEMVDFENHLSGASFVITGEGRIDNQSLGGKVPIGVSRMAKEKNVPVIAIVGIVKGDISQVYSEGITAVFNTNRQALPFEEIIKTAKEDYKNTLEDVLRLMQIKV